MINSTAGTWLNYGTTVVFQILFARAFGTGPQASAFIIAQVTAVSLASILSGTVHVIALPRLMAPDGAIHTGPLKFMTVAALLSIAIATVLALFSNQLVYVASGGAAASGDLGRAAAAFLVARVAAGLFATIALARGHRFAPLASPSIPSIIAVAYLLGWEQAADAASTLAVLAIGSAVEVAVLAMISLRRMALTPGGIGDVRILALATAAQLALLATLPPIQRVMSSFQSPTGAATAHYGLQSLQVGQILLIGGLTAAAFADWSHLRGRADLGAALARATASGSLLLVCAGAIGAVAAPTLVRILFQRGSFTENDTAAVVTVIRLGVIGFAADGVALIAAQLLVATRHNWLAIRIGVVRAGVIVLLTVAGGLIAGADGVAVAYSVGAVVTLLMVWPLANRLVTLTSDARATLRRVVLASGLIGTTAVAVLFLAPSWPDLVLAALVMAASAFIITSLRLPIRSWRLT